MVLSSLLASVLAIVAASGGGGLSPEPRSQDPIRVLSSSYEIHFPGEVVLTLEAEAEADRLVRGIPLHNEVIQWFQDICNELNIPYQLEIH